MNEILKLKDVLRYTKYDTETGIVILINDVLNLHLRPSSIDQMTVTTSPDRTTVHLSTKLTDEITKDGGKLYTGDVEVTFDKMDVSQVYPGGFSIDRWMGIDRILSTLFRKTRVKIDKSECDIIMTDPVPILRFKETSIFWKGDLDIKLNDLPIIVEMGDASNSIDDFITGDTLDGFDISDNIDDFISSDTLDGFDISDNIDDFISSDTLDGFDVSDSIDDFISADTLNGFTN